MVSVNGHTKIMIEDDMLVVESYRTRDTSVVAHFKRSSLEDRGPELDRCLSVGVRAVEAAGPLLDAGYVEREFSETVRRQRQAVEEGKEALKAELQSSLTPLFGDSGSVPAALKRTQDAIERELRKYLDKDSAQSISATVAKTVEEPLRASERRIERALREALDVTDDSRGLGKVLKAIRTEAEASGQKLTELMAKVSGVVERRDERETSTRKGADFEEAVISEVARIATMHGDSAEATGTTTGAGGNQRGDAVITLDSSIAKGAEVRLAIEAMDRTSVSQKAVLRELDGAKENRVAVGAIAVLSSRDVAAACGQVLQRHPGSRYICVLDKQTWDSLPLEVACWAARVDALMLTETAGAVGVDVSAASTLVDQAIGHLTLLDRLRAKLGASRTALNDAEGIIGDIEGKLTRCLSEVAAILAGGGGA